LIVYALLLGVATLSVMSFVGSIFETHRRRY